MIRKLTTLLTLTATLALPAQDETKTEPIITTALTVKTADMMTGMILLGQFAPGTTLPELPALGHYVLTLSSDGGLKTSTATGDIGWLHATLHPPALMELYAEPIDARWGMIAGFAMTAMGQVGMPTKDAAKVMKAVKLFPQQITAIDISLSAHPKTAFKGLKVSFDITPAPDSWLGNFVRHLRPSANGAPRLTAKDSILTMAAAIDPEGMNTFLTPLLEVAAGIATKNKSERQRNLVLYTKIANLQDGTFCAVGDPWGGGFRSVAGLRDGTGFAELLHSAEYARLMDMRGNMSPLIEIEFKPGALEHRDVRVARTIATMDIDTPAMPAGDVITYTAVAGDYLLTTQALAVDEAKKLIDSGLDQGIDRTPLPNGALFVLDVKLMDMLDKISPFGNPFAAAADKAPERFNLSMHSKSGTLQFKLRFE